MKRFSRVKSIYTFYILLVACSQNQNPNETQKLELIAKTWGLIKYYHEDIATGQLNWDSLLVKQISPILKTKTANEFQQQLDQFLFIPNVLEPQNKLITIKDSIEQQVSFKWIKSSFLSSKSQELLESLHNRSVNFNSKYISNKAGSRQLGYARFYEDPLADADLNKVEYRLLGLFRYWNIINYFFPYKNLTDKNWDAVLTEYIPRFISASSKSEYYKELLLLSAEINDAHAFIPYHPQLRSNFFGRLTVPFRIRFIENNFVVTHIKSDSLAKLVDIQIGDIISSIDGEPIIKKASALGQYVAKPNKPYQYSEICRLILNGNQQSLNVELMRNDNKLTRKLNRYSFADIRKYRDRRTIDMWSQLNDQILYVHMGELTLNKLPIFFKKLNKQNGLILDFRYYPNWDVMYEFLSYFYTENKPFALFKSQYLQKPGYYRWHQDISSFDFIDLKPNPFKQKIIILVDERTLSLGEYFVMALQQLDQVIVIGSQTAGEDGNQVGIDMPGAMKLFMSSLGIYYPNGDNSQRSGIKIDQTTSMTINDIRSGSDAVLNKAISLLQTEY